MASHYHWETPDGNIVSNTDSFAILVDEPGHYILNGTAIQGCTEAKDTFYVPDLTKDVIVEIVDDTTWDCTLETILIGFSNGDLFHWSGPNGFTSSDTIVEVTDPGIYVLDVQDALSGCWGSDTIYVSRIACEDVDPGSLPFDGNLAVMWDVLIPNFTVPSDVTIDCSDDPDDLTLTGDVTDESDNCTVDIGEATYTDSVELICGGEMKITRTWLLVDDCGNPASAEQIIYLQDTLAPEFLPPADLTLDCTDNPYNVFTTGFPTYLGDNCDPAQGIFIHTNDVLQSCDGESVITRTWAIQDDCGNVATATQVITVVDETAPTFTTPADITLECGTDINDLTFTGDVLDEADDCDGSIGEATYSDITMDTPCPNEIVVQRTWELADDCGNLTTDIQTITLIDTIAPTFTLPSDVTIECTVDINDLTFTGDVTDEADNCDGVVGEATYMDAVIGTPCPNEQVVQRTWALEDDCGNLTTGIQAITVIDTVPPTFAVPADLTIDCADDPTDLTLTGDVTDEADNCDATANEATYTDEITVNTPCEGASSIERTWTLADDCGNVTTAVQIITLTDTTPPVFVETPNDTTAACDALPAPQDPVYTDDCSSVTLDFNETTTDGECVNRYTITRTWTIIDGCGNSNSHTQEIQVENCNPVVEATIDSGIEVCEKEPVFISSQVGYDTPNYQWQFSADGITWQDVAGATDSIFQLDSTELTHAGWYRIIAADSPVDLTNPLCNTISDSIQLVVKPMPPPTFQVFSICEGDSIEINGNTYSTGGTIVDTLVAANGCDSVVTTGTDFAATFIHHAGAFNM